MSKKEFPVLSAVLYVLAGLLGLYTIWAAVNSFDYVSMMVAQNQLAVSGNEFEIANFYMSNFAQHALFAIILFALGRILQKISARPVYTGDQLLSSDEILVVDPNDDDLEDLVQANDQ